MDARKLLTVGSVALISLASGAAAMPLGKAPAMQSGHGPILLAQAEAVDPRAPVDLSVGELRARILLLKRLADEGQSVNGVTAGELLRADRQELKRRRDGDAAQSEAPEDEAATDEKETESAAEAPAEAGDEPRKRRRKPGSQEPEAETPAPEEAKPQEPAPQPRETEEAAPEQPVEEAPARETTQEAAPEPEPEPEQDATPEQPAPKQEETAEEPASEVPVERPRRKAEPTAPSEEQPAAEDKPRRKNGRAPAEETQEAEPAKPRGERTQPEVDLSILRDRRPATELTDAALRERIRALVDLQRATVLNRRQARRLQATLEADREELNRRISATTGVDVDRIDANREARRLLADDRPARRLNDEELRERIRLTRGVLALEGLDSRFEERLRRALREDRQEIRARVAEAEAPQIIIRDPQRLERRELRRRMFEAREERRRRLDDPSYRIVIPEERVVRRPLATIPLAETYDEELEYQLSAPPVRPLERRYSLEEYRANPSLRTLMPGVEVDTVKFGFNEDFLREEEIVKLDRIGAIIERIIAGNPDEVFLIEGHTDLVGSDAYNEALSYRRAAAVRDALTEFFYIPEGNLEIIGYGEQYPRIPTEFEEPENRRVTVRRITPILSGHSQ